MRLRAGDSDDVRQTPARDDLGARRPGGDDDRNLGGAGASDRAGRLLLLVPSGRFAAFQRDDRIDAEPGAAAGLGVQLDATRGADREALAALRQFRGLRCAVAPADGMGAAVSRDGVAGDVAPLVVPAVLRPGCAEKAGQLVDTPGLPHRL